MHNLTKIKIYRLLLRISYLPSLLFIFPFALLRKKNTSKLFFFFDRYAIGGAQKVHLDILESVSDTFKMVFFTRKSINKKLKQTFYSLPLTENHDIHFWCDNLLFRLFSVHYFAFFLNRHTEGIVLSSNSTFFYDMLPFLKKIYRIELLHNFTYGNHGMEFFGLANRRYLDKRLVIDGVTRNKIEAQYKAFKIDQTCLNKVEVIEYGVYIPASLSRKDGLPLRILYAGRGGPQKRVWLINQIAEYCMNRQLPVEFHFAGTMQADLSEMVKANAIMHGEIGNQDEMNSVYALCHVITLTSAYEGFPVFIKEGMAFGCVPVVTALEGNKLHLEHLSNALLIDEITDESQVVSLGIKNLQLLIDRPDLLNTLSKNAYQYASKHFGKTIFLNRYREILLKNVQPKD
ncbi:MAG TPA: glycosyltransferase family 4 protein [Puia sp.]|nr:glycosyltransferase family 4 protein [Puia sp.]